jgi:UDP-N-acetylmuramoylalanine--D-glutamate ligase
VVRRSTKPRPPLPEGPFLVVGLARSGQAAARLLAGRGETVHGADSGSPAGAEGLREAGVEVHLDGDGVGLLDETRCVVKSPGVPREAPVIAAAGERGIEVLGELELAWRALPNAFVGVTGTNGKTTVTELLGHIWREAGEPVAVAGNIGTPLSSLPGDVDPEATVICECSSFQLEDATAFAPECAVLLNVAPDHLDRHRDLADYTEAKLRIFANQAEGDVAIYDSAEPALAGHEAGGGARRVDPGEAAGLVDSVKLALAGPHGRSNALAAAAAARAMGIDDHAIRAGLESFRGLEHRLEQVSEIDGVAYVNDSKATNVAAAIAALQSFDSGIHAILGGSSKGESFEALERPVSERCRACWLIGETAPALERDLAGAGVPLHRCDGLDDAVRRAAEAARNGEVVLLAPACASFDAFRDYAERGERFRELVRELER